MRLLIDDLPQIHHILSLPNQEYGPEFDGERLNHTEVSGDSVILPDPFDGLSIGFGSDGETYEGICVIECGSYAPRADIRRHLGRQYKDRWHPLGRLNKGHFLDKDKRTALITCETVKRGKAYNFRINLGGACPLKIGSTERFIREGTTFQHFIQASLDAFLEDIVGKNGDKIVIPGCDVYALLRKVDYDWGLSDD